MPSSVTPTTLLLRQIEKSQELLPAVRDGDSTAIHDARVATRRMRELVPLVGGLMPSDTERLDRTLRKATRRLGRARDMEVMLETLAALEPAAPTAAGEIGRLRLEWHEKRDRRVRRAIKSLERMDIETTLRELHWMLAPNKPASARISKARVSGTAMGGNARRPAPRARGRCGGGDRPRGRRGVPEAAARSAGLTQEASILDGNCDRHRPGELRAGAPIAEQGSGSAGASARSRCAGRRAPHCASGSTAPVAVDRTAAAPTAFTLSSSSPGPARGVRAGGPLRQPRPPLRHRARWPHGGVCPARHAGDTAGQTRALRQSLCRRFSVAGSARCPGSRSLIPR